MYIYKIVLKYNLLVCSTKYFERAQTWKFQYTIKNTHNIDTKPHFAQQLANKIFSIGKDSNLLKRITSTHFGWRTAG